MVLVAELLGVVTGDGGLPVLSAAMSRFRSPWSFIAFVEGAGEGDDFGAGGGEGAGVPVAVLSVDCQAGGGEVAGESGGVEEAEGASAGLGASERGGSEGDQVAAGRIGVVCHADQGA